MMCNKNYNQYIGSMDWLDYAILSDNYIKSAEIICEHKEIEDDHGLVMPVIYLLKHAIELSFKKILKFNFAVDNKKLHTHDLKELEKLFLQELLILWNSNNGLQKLWDEIKQDRLIDNPKEFDEFVNNFQKNIDTFLKNSGFVPNDKLNQEQRFPYGEYSEPTTIIVNSFFSKKDKIVELAMKITVDIDIIFDFILRVKSIIKS